MSHVSLVLFRHQDQLHFQHADQVLPVIDLVCLIGWHLFSSTTLTSNLRGAS